MAQGKTKGLQAKASNNSRHAAKAAANTKKGKRAIAPKKPILVKQAAMKKVCFLSEIDSLQISLINDSLFPSRN